MNKAEIMKTWEHKLSVIEKYSEGIPVLDHGHVRLIDLMGDDTAIVQAARVSYGLGHSGHELPAKEPVSLKAVGACTVCGLRMTEVPNLEHCPQGDRRLIRYLSRHRHSTPLEMCEIKLHMKMPIFVARQFIRHRTANVNEYSMRYSPAIEEFYLIGVDEWRAESTTNKQGSDAPISAAYGRELTAKSSKTHMDLLADYERKIRYGVSKELARCDLPLSMYTEWYWKIDLHNLLHFISLRMDPHAQKEIRVYADAMAEIVKRWVPYAWEAFVDYRFEATTFSRQETNLIRDILKGSVVLRDFADVEVRKGLFKTYGVETERERIAFMKTLGISGKG